MTLLIQIYLLGSMCYLPYQYINLAVFVIHWGLTSVEKFIFYIHEFPKLYLNYTALPKEKPLMPDHWHMGMLTIIELWCTLLCQIRFFTTLLAKLLYIKLQSIIMHTKKDDLPGIMVLAVGTRIHLLCSVVFSLFAFIQISSLSRLCLTWQMNSLRQLIRIPGLLYTKLKLGGSF